MSDIASLKIVIDSKEVGTALTRLKELETQAGRTAKAVSGGANSLEASAARAAKPTVSAAKASSMLSRELNKLSGDSTAASTGLVKVEQEAKRLNSAAEASKMKFSDLSASMRKLITTLDPVNRAASDTRAAVSLLAKAEADGAISSKQFELAHRELTRELAATTGTKKQAAVVTEELNASMQRFLNKADPLGQKIKQLKTDVELWDQKLKDKVITDREHSAVIKKLYSDLGALTGRKKEVKEQTVKLTASMRSLLATADPLGAKISSVREKMASLAALEKQGTISTGQYNAALKHLYSTLGSTAKASDDMTAANRRASASMQAASTAAKKSNIAISGLEEGFRTLRSAVVGYVGLQGVQFLASVADEATNVRNRLRAVTSSTEELNSVFNDLARVSANARVDLQTSANLYQRMTMGTEHLGLSQEKLIRLTETIGKSFKISGATADEASGSIRQLTQAFNANMLRGEELNSINEQAPILMKAIQRELGMTGKELRDFAETGGITADIMVSAFTRIEKEVDELFTQTAKTVEDRLTDIRRSWVVWADENESLNQTLLYGTELLNAVSIAAMEALDAITPLVNGIIGAYGAFGDLIGLLAKASGMFDDVSGSMDRLNQTGDRVATGVLTAIGEVVKALATFAELLIQPFNMAFHAIEKAVADVLNPIVKLIADVLEFAGEKSAAASFRAMRIEAKGAGQAVIDLDHEFGMFRESVDEYVKTTSDTTFANNEVVESLEEVVKVTDRMRGSEKKLRDEVEASNRIRSSLLAEHIALINSETHANELGGEALLRFKASEMAAAEAKRINKKLKGESVQLTQAETKALEDAYFVQLKTIAAEKEAAKAKKEADKATKDALEVLKKDFEERKKATYELEKALQAARQEMQNMAMEFMRSIDPSIAKLEELNKEAQGVGAAFSLGLIDEAQFKAHITRITTDMDRVKNGLETIEVTADRIGGVFSGVFGQIGDELGGLGQLFSEFGDMLGKDFVGGLKGIESSLGSLFGGDLKGFAGGLSSLITPEVGTAALSTYSNAILKDIGQGDYKQMLDKILPGFFVGTLAEKLGVNFGGRPSDKTQIAGLALGTGDLTQRGFLTGDKFSEENRAAADISAALLGDVARQLADTFGKEFTGQLDFVVGSRDGIRVEFEGKELFRSNDITQTLTQATEFLFSMAGATSDIYASLAQDGESLGEAFLRLESQFSAVTDFASILNLNLDSMSATGLEAADTMVQIAGGIDAFVQAANTYYDKFFTEQEKQEDLFESLTKSFADLGYEVPKSRSAYRQLVESADAETAQLLIGMSGNLDRFLTSRESFAAKITDAYENILGREPDLAGFEYWITRLESGQITINDFIEGLSTSAEKLAKDKKDAYLTDPDNTFVVDMGNKSFNNLLDSVKNSIEYAKEYAKAINEFSTTMARDAELSGMSAEDKDITNLRVWRDGLIAQLDALAAGGGLSKSNYESILNDIETQYLNGLSDINSKYNKIDDSAEKLLEKLNEQAKDFTSGLAIDAAFEGLEGKEADLFKLEQWYSNTISKLNQLIADGATIEGGVEAAMANITKIYDIRLGNINQSYYEKVAEDYAKMEEDLADKVANAKDTVIDAYDRELEALITFTDKMSGLSDQLRGYAQSLLTSDLSPLSPAAQLQAARSQFMDVSRRARLGDTDAMSQLTGVSDTFLRESREFQGSAGTYASDFQMVQEAVNAAADVADRQKDQGEVQIEQLKMQVQGLSDVKNEVITLQEALAALIVVQQESAKELQRQGNTLDGLKSNSDLELSA